MKLTSEEIRNAIFEYGLEPSFLEKHFEDTFVSYDWIAPDEADLIDKFFSNKVVIVFPFGQFRHPSVFSEETMSFDDAVSQINIPPCGNFIIYDYEDRILILNNARNLYVYAGPAAEVSKLFALLDPHQDVEQRYLNSDGDFEMQFAHTRKFYENYREAHNRSRNMRSS
ncbi:hypothetical protein [Fulvimarina sp. MAC8]|uniref:hypothetical protein n=1 Tax=Fulvimarina sp. MAC8 TaxID=3162874 RepID=UPI0032EE3998